MNKVSSNPSDFWVAENEAQSLNPPFHSLHIWLVPLFSLLSFSSWDTPRIHQTPGSLTGSQLSLTISYARLCSSLRFRLRAGNISTLLPVLRPGRARRDVCRRISQNRSGALVWAYDMVTVLVVSQLMERGFGERGRQEVGGHQNRYLCLLVVTPGHWPLWACQISDVLLTSINFCAPCLETSQSSSPFPRAVAL